MKTYNISHTKTDVLDRHQPWDQAAKPLENYSDEDGCGKLYRNRSNLKYKITPAMLSRIPAEERKCILLYYYENLTQTAIAKRLNRTQGAVSSRLRRCRERIKFFLLRDKFTLAELERDLNQLLSPIDLTIVKLIFEHVSFTTVVGPVSDIFPEYSFSYTKIRESWKLSLSLIKRFGATNNKYCVAMRFLEKNVCILCNQYSAAEYRIAQHGAPVPKK